MSIARREQTLSKSSNKQLSKRVSVPAVKAGTPRFQQEQQEITRKYGEMAI